MMKMNNKKTMQGRRGVYTVLKNGMNISFSK